jgi:hypothetical protein
MTQASNLANFANNLNTSGQVDPNALSSQVPIAKGGTNATSETGARANLNVPTRTGGDASGTWGINITGNANTATNATNSTNATKLVTTNWIVEEVSGQLYFKTSAGVLKFSMHSTDGFTVY